MGDYNRGGNRWPIVLRAETKWQRKSGEGGGVRARDWGGGGGGKGGRGGNLRIGPSST